MPAASNDRASSTALLLLRISIEKPSREARKSRLNAPNENEWAPCGAIFSGSATSRISM